MRAPPERGLYDRPLLAIANHSQQWGLSRSIVKLDRRYEEAAEPVPVGGFKAGSFWNLEVLPAGHRRSAIKSDEEAGVIGEQIRG
jgi:hypothetical protein